MERSYERAELSFSLFVNLDRKSVVRNTVIVDLQKTICVQIEIEIDEDRYIYLNSCQVSNHCNGFLKIDK